MTILKRKFSTGWFLVLLALLVTGAFGLRTGSSSGNFDLAGDHLWANIAWMITATIFVLMMTPGLSFFYGGMVRPKNVISTMLQSFIVMGFVSVIWVVFGFSLAFGNDIGHVIGNPLDFFMMNGVGVTNVTDPAAETSQIGLATTTIPLALFALFQMKFAIITPCACWVTVGQSIFISIFITVCCNMAVCWNGYSRVLDDALDVFPTHGLGGILGTLLTGIFAYDYFAAQDPAMISRGEFFFNHVLVLAGVFVYTFGMSYLLYWLTDRIVPMRVSRQNEREGLDVSQHGEEYGAEAPAAVPSQLEWFQSFEEN